MAALRTLALIAVAFAVTHAVRAPAARAEEPSPQQRIAMIAKPSVVRVWGAYIATYDLEGNKIQEAIGGSGTGWFMTPDGYVATNAHVVSDIQGGDQAAKDALWKALLKDLDKQFGPQLRKMSDADIRRLLGAIKLVEVKKWAYIVLPNGEHLDYEIKQFGKPGTGRDAAIIKVKIDNAPTLPIGDSSKSQVEDHIVVIGYPGVADFKELLDDKSQLEASVTDGAISSLKRAASGEQILQISAPITHGNSGGPAIDQHGNVVGLATFGNDGDVQGFNFLVASATLLELVHDGKVEPKDSATNKAWNTGLEHFWADEYTDAVTAFEEVETLFPSHAEAPRLIRLAHQAQKDGKEKKPANSSALVGGLVGGGFVLAGLAVFLVRRGRRPAMAAPGSYGMMPGTPPQGYPGAPPPGYPGAPGPAQPQMYGRVQPAASGSTPAMQPIAKTVAVAGGGVQIGSLVATRGPLAGQRFPLAPSGIIVGRQPGVAHVLINDHRASGKHVWIGFENGRLVAIDQGTTNGTYINDPTRGRITRAELRDGDYIIVGEPDCLTLQIKLGA